jgi:hypothetical protein
MPNLPRNPSSGDNINRSGLNNGDKTWQEATDTWEDSNPHTWEDYKNTDTSYSIDSTNMSRSGTAAGANVGRNSGASSANMAREGAISGSNLNRN